MTDRPVSRLCHLCGTVMHPLLTQIGYTTHPTCRPRKRPLRVVRERR